MDAVVHRVRSGVNTLYARFLASETAVMVTMAALVGMGTGLGTIAFVRLIDLCEELFFAGGISFPGLLGKGLVVLLPALGGLLVGPIVYFIAPEAKGHGVPEVMDAILTQGGRIRPVVVVAKAIGSAITIGSGGSVGREGPIVQIGSALGSTIGQKFHLSERRLVNLIASGAAGGIAATFNAPIAGVMFALEVILGEFTIYTFSTIVVAAVTASVISRTVLGSSPAFIVPAYSLVSPWELVLYLGLGGVAALGAVTFVKALYWLEDRFDEWAFPPYLKPAVGGLGLGILGYFLPQVFGTGFETIENALTNRLGLGLLLVLVLAKILATSLTLGSGASGGVFAPALFIGAVLGGAYGEVVHHLFPQVTAASGAYAMVGMAAVFSGAARAPITSVLILFEMTQDYRIILPLMFATAVSTLVAGYLEPESIYTLKLSRRGLDVRARRDMDLMRTIPVEEAMTPISQMDTVTPDTSLRDLARLFQETSHHGLPVVDKQGELYGVVTLADLEKAMKAGRLTGTVKDICTTRVRTVFPDETLEDALRHFGALDVGRIPVVDRSNPKRLVGMLRRSDIIRAYSHALLDRQEVQHRLERLRLERATGTELVELELDSDAPAVGRKLKDLKLSPDCVIVAILRGGKVVVPRGETQLRAGDRVVALTTGRGEDMLRTCLFGA